MSDRFIPAVGLFEERCADTGRPCSSEDLVQDTTTGLYYYKDCSFVANASTPAPKPAAKKTTKKKAGGKKNG